MQCSTDNVGFTYKTYAIALFYGNFILYYLLRIRKSYIQRFFFVKLNIVQLRFSLEIGRDKHVFRGHGYYSETCF